MKTWKPILTFVLASVFALGAFAQQAGPNGGGLSNGKGGEQGKAGKAGGIKGMQKIEQEIWAKLTPPLTDDQKAKLKSIDDKTKSSVKALRGKGQNGDREAMKGEMQKIIKERRESIQALLTPEQKKSYEQLIRDAMQKFRKDGKGKGIG